MCIFTSNPFEFRFEDLPEENWPRHEIIDGSLHVTPPTDLWHQGVASDLLIALVDAAPDGLEPIIGVGIMRRGATDRVLIPDVSVLTAASAFGGEPMARPEGVFFVAEVISPSTREIDLHLKKQLYAEWGIGTYWVLDPVAQEVHEFGTRDSSTCWLAGIDLSRIWPAEKANRLPKGEAECR
jgi:Uma2 family endonuclease